MDVSDPLRNIEGNLTLVKLSTNGWKSVLRSMLAQGTVGANSALSFASLTSQLLSSVVLLMILARLVEVSVLGEILYAIALAHIVEVLSSYGLGNLVIREISQERQGVAQITSTLLLAKLFLSVIFVLLVRLYVGVVGVPLGNPGDAWFYVAAGLVNSFVNSVSALRKGQNDFVTEVKISLFRSGLFFTATLAAIYSFGATTLLVGQIRLLSRVVSLAFAIAVLFKGFSKDGYLPDSGRLPELVAVCRLLVVGFPFALQAFLGLAYFQLGTLILGALTTSTEVGYYQSSMQIVLAAMLLPLAIVQAYYPRLAKAFSTGDTNGMRLMRQMMSVLTTLGFCLTAMFGLGAPFLITLLYGTKMQPGIIVLQILSLVFIVRSAASGLGISLIALGWQKVQVLAGFVATVGGLLLNLLLIPRYGFVATAWVNLATNLAVLGIYAVAWKKLAGRLEASRERGNHNGGESLGAFRG